MAYSELQNQWKAVPLEQAWVRMGLQIAESRTDLPKVCHQRPMSIVIGSEETNLFGPAWCSRERMYSCRHYKRTCSLSQWVQHPTCLNIDRKVTGCRLTNFICSSLLLDHHDSHGALHLVFKSVCVIGTYWITATCSSPLDEQEQSDNAEDE